MDSTENIRKLIISKAETLLSVPYKFGYQLPSLDIVRPEFVDCSEFTRWAFHQAGLFLPDGSFNQFEATTPTDSPKPGDLGFFKETDDKNTGGRKIGQIYHVGIWADDVRVIEARGAPYNKVIYRPTAAWREYKNFAGWRSHIQLL